MIPVMPLTCCRFLLLMLSCGCATTVTVAPEGRVAHTVYFWLKADAPPGTADAMVDYYRRVVPTAAGIESVVVGVPRPSDRDVVDDSFSVGATTVFVSSAAEVAWQTDPIHDELRRRFLDFVDRIVVYDTRVIAPR